MIQLLVVVVRPALDAALTVAEEAHESFLSVRAEAQAALDAARSTEAPATSEQLEALRAKKAQLTEDLASAKLGSQSALEGLQAEKAKHEAAIAQHQTALHSIREVQKTQKRIEELREEAKKHAATAADAEKHIYLLEEFTRARVKFLTDRINGFFQVTTWKLFDEQVNGGITEICEAMHEGVPYKDLNTGMKLNVGLDVIDTLAKHHGFAPPIWIDNAESITAIRPTIGQQMQLIVSAEDKVLRTEALA